MNSENAEGRLPDGYFDAVYEGGLDPWGFDSRWYEARKRAVTLAALPHLRYRRAFEPGCAIGVLTRELAERCDQVVAWDLNADALAECTRRCRDLANVRTAMAAVPDRWPDGDFDLIVLSEVAYYLNADGLGSLVSGVSGSLVPGGAVVAVHWLGATDYPLSGEETHRVLGGSLDLRRTVHHADQEFVLDVWERDLP